MQKIEPLFLSTEESLSTSSYLGKLAREFPSMAVRVQSLFGRCCLASAFDLDLDDLGLEAMDLVDRILRDPEQDRLELDPLLLIEIHQMLKSAEVRVAVFDELLGRIAALLVAQPPEVHQAGRARNIAAQLASLGFHIRPAKPSREMALLLDSPDRWFGCSVEQLTEIAHHFSADGGPLDAISGRILALLALAELRNYRVDLGCTLLRAVFDLSTPSLESTEALNFIALQRRRDGRYGFPNQFAEGAASQTDPHLSVFLPLTVNAVWLFRSAQRSRQQLQSAVTA